MRHLVNAPFMTKINLRKVKTLDLIVPMEIEAYLECIVRDKQGNVTSYLRKKSESFVRQFIELLYIKASSIYTTSTYQIRDTGNTLRNCYNYGTTYMSANGLAAAITHGIVIGTDNTAPTINDYQLGAIIAHATMNYSAMTFGAVADDGATAQFRLTRDFANVSGGAVTVEEVGVYQQGYDGSTRYFCTIRDVTGGINVPNGQTLTINYQIQGTAANGIVRQFLDFLYALTAYVNGSIRDTSNTLRVTNAGNNFNDLIMCSTGGDCMMAVGYAPGNFYQANLGDRFGIQVGTGAVAVNTADYVLGTKIAHGAGAGQLIYAGSEIELPVIAAPNATMLMRRFFYNKSGGGITVNEVGMYTWSTNVAYQFMLFRALTGGVAVADNELLRVQYTFQITV